MVGCTLLAMMNLILHKFEIQNFTIWKNQYNNTLPYSTNIKPIIVFTKLTPKKLKVKVFGKITFNQ
jgi:hypothetical protein